MQKHGASFFVFSGKPFHCNTKGVSKYLQFKVGNQPLTGLYAADRHLTHLQTTELLNCTQENGHEILTHGPVRRTRI